MFIVNPNKGGYQGDVVNTGFRKGRQDAFRDYTDNFMQAVNADKANEDLNQQQINNSFTNYINGLKATEAAKATALRDQAFRVNFANGQMQVAGMNSLTPEQRASIVEMNRNTIYNNAGGAEAKSQADWNQQILNSTKATTDTALYPEVAQTQLDQFKANLTGTYLTNDGKVLTNASNKQVLDNNTAYVNAQKQFNDFSSPQNYDATMDKVTGGQWSKVLSANGNDRAKARQVMMADPTYGTPFNDANVQYEYKYRNLENSVQNARSVAMGTGGVSGNSVKAPTQPKESQDPTEKSFNSFSDLSNWKVQDKGDSYELMNALSGTAIDGSELADGTPEAVSKAMSQVNNVGGSVYNYADGKPALVVQDNVVMRRSPTGEVTMYRARSADEAKLFAERMATSNGLRGVRATPPQGNGMFNGSGGNNKTQDYGSFPGYGW